MKQQKFGFTIVELLIVIVVIGILAAITIVAFNGIQERARNTKIDSDLSQIQKAVKAARISNDSALYGVYPYGAPEGPCTIKYAGTDLAALPKTDGCWVQYTNFLDAVSEKSGMNIRNMVDPWQRPYYVNPNEDENQTTHVCLKDQIGMYNQPFDKGRTKVINIPLHKASCP